MKSSIIIVVIVIAIVVYFNFSSPSSVDVELTETEAKEELTEKKVVSPSSQQAETGNEQQVEELTNTIKTVKESNNFADTGQADARLVEPGQQVDPVPQEFLVTFDGETYSPEILNIKQGDIVTWTNESETRTWPASSVHPTHTVYPTTGGCLGSTLDACKGLEFGESFNFTFDEAGTWKMHDHLAPFIGMTVIVSE